MKYKDFFEIFFICCSIIGYIRLAYYVLYTRIFTDEKYVKYEPSIVLLFYLYFIHSALVSYMLKWTKHPILIGIGFTLLLYQLQMKQVKPMIEKREK